MKVAIIGAGLVAKTFHIPAFQACEGVKITAIYDRKPEKAKALADAVGAEPFSDYDELLRHGDIDAVSICTPNRPSLPDGSEGRQGSEEYIS